MQSLDLVFLTCAVLPIQAKSADKGDSLMLQYYFVQLFGTREGWPEDVTPDEMKIMNDHFDYLKRLVARKKVYMAGPVFDAKFGLIILAVESEAEAREIMDSEPSVKAGLHSYALSSMTVSLLVDHRSPDRYVTDPSDRMVRKEVVVPATADQVWETWTTTEGLKTFFSANARVELQVGGPFEIYFLMDNPYGSRGSEDCTILSYLPKKMLAFEWNAPPQFGELRDKRTQVILEFTAVDPEHTRVILAQIGWGEGAEWRRLYDYFDRAWEIVLGNFKKRFESGPIQWSDD
jgi:uncharacterized protein YndB with AHSA1/START domain/uncharacterized protein YciI